MKNNTLYRETKKEGLIFLEINNCKRRYIVFRKRFKENRFESMIYLLQIILLNYTQFLSRANMGIYLFTLFDARS